MIRLKRGAAAIAVLCLLAGACDGGASAVAVPKAGSGGPGGDGADVTLKTGEAASAGSTRPSTVDRAPVPKINGRPMWSATRRFSAEQNARRAFERNGATFGAATLEAFVQKAHAFVSKPPRGSLTMKRANGDTLIYDPAGNVFAVVTRDGAPRTMFRPDEGMAYWEQVKTQEAARTSARRKGSDEG